MEWVPWLGVKTTSKALLRKPSLCLKKQFDKIQGKCSLSIWASKEQMTEAKQQIEVDSQPHPQSKALTAKARKSLLFCVLLLPSHTHFPLKSPSCKC